MNYRRRPTPLHAARAVVASAWCVVLAGVALSFEHPVLLAAVLTAVLLAAAGAQAGAAVARALAWSLPFAVLIAVVNALVVRDGLTVIARLGSLAPLGQVDVTLEALSYGGVLGLRALVVIGCFALHSAVVDPDELLRAFRRISYRSALTAVLATRLVPVLGRDARRFADAQRCRPGLRQVTRRFVAPVRQDVPVALGRRPASRRSAEPEPAARLSDHRPRRRRAGRSPIR